MNFYYEIGYDYPGKRATRKNKNKIKTSKQRINFLSLMFSADKESILTKFLQKEFLAYNNLFPPKHIFNKGDTIYSLVLVNAKGSLCNLKRYK